VNVNGFFDSCIELLVGCEEQRVMDVQHPARWWGGWEPQALGGAIDAAPPWTAAARDFAQVK